MAPTLSASIRGSGLRAVAEADAGEDHSWKRKLLGGFENGHWVCLAKCSSRQKNKILFNFSVYEEPNFWLNFVHRVRFASVLSIFMLSCPCVSPEEQWDTLVWSLVPILLQICGLRVTGCALSTGNDSDRCWLRGQRKGLGILTTGLWSRGRSWHCRRVGGCGEGNCFLRNVFSQQCSNIQENKWKRSPVWFEETGSNLAGTTVRNRTRLPSPTEFIHYWKASTKALHLVNLIIHLSQKHFSEFLSCYTQSPKGTLLFARDKTCRICRQQLLQLFAEGCFLFLLQMALARQFAMLLLHQKNLDKMETHRSMGVGTVYLRGYSHPRLIRICFFLVDSSECFF